MSRLDYLLNYLDLCDEYGVDIPYRICKEAYDLIWGFDKVVYEASAVL